MNESLRRKLDRITKALFGGGVTNPVTYIEQISHLIFLKLLDERGTPEIFDGVGARYRWQSWVGKSGASLRDFLRDEVFPYMAASRQSPQVAEYFGDAVLEILDPHVLATVVGDIDSIRFGDDRINFTLYDFQRKYRGANIIRYWYST